MARKSAAVAAAALLGLACVTTAGTSASAQEETFFRIGTGSTGGTYFPIGGLIANVISNPPGARPCDKGGSCGPRGLIAFAQSTAGSVANVEGIREGRLESGLVQADIAHWAYKGARIFRGKGKRVEKLRAIANLYPEQVQLIVRRDSKIKSVAALRGKRVSLGLKDSGTRVDAEIILRAHGLGARSIRPRYLNPGPAGQALRDGKLDAFFLVAGTPAAAVSELANGTPIALVPITGRRVERLLKRYPFFSAGLIPADVYNGVAAVETLNVGAQWVVAADQPDDLVYAITRALWHKNARAILDAGHPKGKTIVLKNAIKGLGIPLHPGAARFYREEGLITDGG